MAEKRKLSFFDFFTFDINRRIFEDYINLVKAQHEQATGIIELTSKEAFQAIKNYYDIITGSFGEVFSQKSYDDYLGALRELGLLPKEK